jgi:all-trans-retinol 13,14-reductase
MSAAAKANGSTAAYDYVIVGSGMAGLTVGSLLANSGRRVLILEAHDTPGGYAHTFPMGDYRFCAQVHYIFHCGEGEVIHRLLDQLGIADEVTFRRLDPEGFEHVVIAGERFRIPSGLAKFRERLIQRFPEAKRPLRRYFAALIALREETAALPDPLGWRDLALAPLRFPNLLRYRKWTLQQFYDDVRMPRLLQAVLAGQCGDYLLPPERVSFLLHAALVANYDSGAYYPDKHFGHFVDSLVANIRKHPGCDVLLEHEVTSIDVVDRRVTQVKTADGATFRAEHYISNVDPTVTMKLTGRTAFESSYHRKLDYEYSGSTFTLYLGLKDLDLRDHGFGSYNVWHYPHADINRIYRDQLEHDDLSDPWLFLATPTLHSDAPGLAPPGHQVLEVATSCRYEYFAALRNRGEEHYRREKIRVRDRILDVLEERYVPGLRKHIAMRVAGTPLTNEQFCRAPRGNAYGSALTPANTWPRISFDTPIRNLFLVNATAGYPSVAGTVSSGTRLYEQLTGGGRG